MRDNSPEQLCELFQPVFDLTSGVAVDQALETVLNEQIPPSSDVFRQIETACHAAIEAGWMCNQGSEGRRFGRVVEPAPVTNDLSIDVVDLTDIVGPHHAHPTGEICMVMPVSEGAQFDGNGAGWCVNEPGSAHNPTVSNGRALVLYLLPQGKIDFT